MPVTDAQVLEALRPVQDPELHMSIVDLDMVKRITVDGGRVEVLVALTVAGCPLRAEITDRVTRAVGALDGVTGVDVDPGQAGGNQDLNLFLYDRTSDSSVLVNHAGDRHRRSRLALGERL